MIRRNICKWQVYDALHDVPLDYKNTYSYESKVKLIMQMQIFNKQKKRDNTEK